MTFQAPDLITFISYNNLYKSLKIILDFLWQGSDTLLILSLNIFLHISEGKGTLLDQRKQTARMEDAVLQSGV